MTDQRQQLWAALHGLREAWIELRLTAREDLPRDGGALAADEFGDHVDDGLGAVEEALAACARLVDCELSPRAAGMAAAVTGERLAAAARIHWRELAAHERQTELRSLARRRGPEWAAWLESVRGALAALPDHLEAAETALRGALLELPAATSDQPEGQRA